MPQVISTTLLDGRAGIRHKETGEIVTVRGHSASLDYLPVFIFQIVLPYGRSQCLVSTSLSPLDHRQPSPMS